MPRPNSGASTFDYIQHVFKQLWENWGSFDMDLMATTATAQLIPAGVGGAARQGPFYSREGTQGSPGINLLSHNIGAMPDTRRERFGFCFPPIAMVGVALQRLAESRAHVVVVIPGQRQGWFLPLLASIRLVHSG